MAYVPPPPGSTTAGQPTPEGIPKQDAHITDLPPEVRKNFLLSMVFFPSMVGATICLVIFLGWFLFFKPKTAMQYAQELSSSDARQRLTAAREMSEHITQYGEKVDNPRIYTPEVLSALIKIFEDQTLDNETFSWSPSGTIKQAEEKTSIRWWAVYAIGHVGAKMKDPADRERAFNALMAAMQEPDDPNTKNTIHILAASGLSLMKDARAVDTLAKHLTEDPNLGTRWACAHALASIGEYQMLRKATFEESERIRRLLLKAFVDENAKVKKDEILLDNLALDLAHMHDSGDGAGRARLNQIKAAHEDPIVRENAKRALEILDTPPKFNE